MSGADDSRPISLILDTSAVLAFAAGSMQVHEPIIVAAEAGENVGVPVTCLLEAVRRDPRAAAVLNWYQVNSFITPQSQ